MCSCQQELVGVEEELKQRNQEIAKLQAKLSEAEKIIVSLSRVGCIVDGLLIAIRNWQFIEVVRSWYL